MAAATATSARTWMLAAAAACSLLLLLQMPRSADAHAGAEAGAGPAEGPSVAPLKPKCVAGAVNTKACRVGAVHDPENQEEERAFSVHAKAPAGAPDTDSDDDYSDPDMPQDDSSLVVLGH